jgi:hypothetical protein
MIASNPQIALSDILERRFGIWRTDDPWRIRKRKELWKTDDPWGIKTPLFEMCSNPQIKFSDIINRRFNLIEEKSMQPRYPAMIDELRYELNKYSVLNTSFDNEVLKEYLIMSFDVLSYRFSNIKDFNIVYRNSSIRKAILKRSLGFAAFICLLVDMVAPVSNQKGKDIEFLKNRFIKEYEEIVESL